MPSVVSILIPGFESLVLDPKNSRIRMLILNFLPRSPSACGVLCEAKSWKLLRLGTFFVPKKFVPKFGLLLVLISTLFLSYSTRKIKALLLDVLQGPAEAICLSRKPVLVNLNTRWSFLSRPGSTPSNTSTCSNLPFINVPWTWILPLTFDPGIHLFLTQNLLAWVNENKTHSEGFLEEALRWLFLTRGAHLRFSLKNCLKMCLRPCFRDFVSVNWRWASLVSVS